MVSFAPNVPWGDGSGGLVALYQDGRPLPKTFGLAGLIDASSDGRTVYLQSAPFHTSFNRLNVLNDGLAVVDATPDLFGGADFRVSNNRIYAGDGQIFDPLSLKQEVLCENVPVPGLALPLPQLGKFVLLTGDRPIWFGSGPPTLQLRVYDSSTGHWLGNAWEAWINAYATALVHCGKDRVAFQTTAGSVYFVRTSLLPTGQPAPAHLDWLARPGQLVLNWPSNQPGWSLQVQTNSVRRDLGTNWVAVPGSAQTNQIAFPISSTDGSVFYRLVHQ